MKRLVSILMLVAMLAPSVRADLWLVTSKGIWKCPTSESGPGDWVQVTSFGSGDTVVFNGKTVSTPDDGGDDGDGDGPGDGDAVAQITKITKDLLKEQEAMGLHAVLRLFAADDADLSQAENGLRIAIGVLSENTLFEGNKFKQWYEVTKPLRESPITKQNIQDMINGVANAYDSIEGAKPLTEEEAIGDRDRNRIFGDGRFRELLETIIEIIKLLKDLGIIGI